MIFLALLLAWGAGCAGGQARPDEVATQPAPPAYFEEIPASTLFFVGGSDPLPKKMVESALDYWAQISTQKLQAAGGQSQSREAQTYEFVVAQMGGELSVEGLSAIGVEQTPRIAIYTFGLTPMLRVGLSDGERFEEFIEAYAQRFEVGIEEREHEGKRYHFVADATGGFIMRYTDGEFVMAAVDGQDLEAFLPYFFGDVTLERSFADENVLAAVREQYGFGRALAGYVDLLRLAQVLNGDLLQVSAAEVAFVERAPLSLLRAPDEVCRGEFVRVVESTPRLVMGLRSYDEGSVDVGFGVALDPAQADKLEQVRGQVPGWGTELLSGAIGSLVWGVNLDGWLAVGSEWALGLQMEPYACPAFVGLNRTAQQLLGMSGQAPKAVTDLRGASLSITGVRLRFDEALEQTLIVPSVVASLSSADAPGLVALASQAVPMVQQIGLEPDGEARKVEVLAAAYPGLVEPMAMMTEKMLGVSMGPGMVAAMRQMLGADQAQGSPFFALRFRTGEWVSTLISDARAVVGQVEQSGDVDADDVAKARAFLDRVEETVPEQGQVFEMSVTLEDEAIFLNYADEGPKLGPQWFEWIGEDSEAGLEALMRVLMQQGPEPAPLVPESAIETVPRSER